MSRSIVEDVTPAAQVVDDDGDASAPARPGGAGEEDTSAADARGFGSTGALAAGGGDARHGRPKRLASPRRACHWSSPTTATNSTV